MAKRKVYKLPVKIEHIQHLIHDGAFSIENKDGSIMLYFYLEEPAGCVLIREGKRDSIVISENRSIF